MEVTVKSHGKFNLWDPLKCILGVLNSYYVLERKSLNLSC